MFASFLRPCYEVTLRVCCSNTPTIHNTFVDVFQIKGRLLETKENKYLSLISMIMLEKYDKYWGSMEDLNQYFFVALVFDPSHKLDKVVDYFEIIFGEDDEKVESNTNAVKDLLIDLYKIHEEDTSSTTQQSVSIGGDSSSQMASGNSTSMTETERKLKEKSEMRKARRARVIHNDVDRYLSDPKKEEEGNFDILNWWRVNGVSKYPILAHVAREILAILLSTIASESSFSTSGRIIDPYRSSLSPKMVEALICTQNWLRFTHVALHHEPTIEEIEFCEEVEKEMSSENSKKGAMLPPRPPSKH